MGSQPDAADRTRRRHPISLSPYVVLVLLRDGLSHSTADATSTQSRHQRSHRDSRGSIGRPRKNQFTQIAVIWCRIGMNIVGNTMGFTSTCWNPEDLSVAPVSLHRSQPSNSHFHGRLNTP